MKLISRKQIQAAAQKIADKIHPKKIILFGSYAYGKPTADSDVDLFVVMNSKKRPVERYGPISKILIPRPFPVDILVRTPAEVKEKLQHKDFFIEEVMSRGIVLYAR